MATLTIAPVLAASVTLAAAQTQGQPAEPPASSAPSSTTTKPEAKPLTQGSQANQTKAPSGTSTSQGGTAKTTPKATTAPPAQPVKKVDLNNASLEELKTLPTVGDAEAKKIIAHRPYKSKGELVTKAGLPEGVYHAVKRKVELQTPRKPAPKK